jgi:hypothetical protein
MPENIDIPYKKYLSAIRLIDSDGRYIDGQPNPLIGAKDERIQSLERNMQCRLPSDYRKFLLSCNGGVPAHGFDPDRTPGVPNLSIIWGTDGNTSNVGHSTTIEGINGFYPGERRELYLLQVAVDESNGYYFMCIRGENYGAIYYSYPYQDGLEYYAEEKQKSLYKAYNSFDDFFLSFIRGFD